MATVASLVVSLEANVAKFVTGIDKANAHLTKMQKSLNLIKFDALVNLGSRALNAGESLYRLMRSTAAAGDEIVRNAAVVNMTTGEYQKWQYVAMRSDVEAVQFATGLKILSRNMYEASQGAKESLEGFSALGVEVKDQAGNLKSYQDILGELAESFAAMPDGPEKVALALKTFGRSGEALIPLLNKGRQGVEELTVEFKSLGIELGEDVIPGLEKADESFERFEAVVKNLKDRALVQIVPLLAQAAENTAWWIKEMRIGSERDQVKELKNLKEWLKYNKEIGASEEVIADYEKRIQEIQKSWEPKPIKLKTTAVFNIDEGDEGKKLEKAIKELEKAYNNLGIQSKKLSEDEIMSQLRSVEVIKKAMADKKASTYDYLNALQAANAKLKEFLGITEATTDKRIKAEEEYQKKVREISFEDPDRQKKVQAAIDDWLDAIKEIEKTKPIDIKIATAEAEKQLNEFIQKASEKEINIKINTEGGGGGGAGEGINIWGIPAEDFFSGEGVQGAASISIFGIGSTKKFISEKIEDIIRDFGGLEKALSGMEAEINLAEYTMQYKALEKKLAQVERILPDLSNIASKSGGSPYVGGPIVQTVKDLTEDLTDQMKILQMRMNYEMLKGYGGSMQMGGLVPKTALYKLHEGERVISKNVSTGDIHVHVEGGQDVVQTLIKTLKYRLSTELKGIL